MGKFILSADSTCDLYADYTREHDIRIACLSYTVEKDGALCGEFYDNFTQYSQYVEFFDLLRGGGFSRTSMLNFEDHYKHFQKIAQEGAKQILHFSLSGGLSGTAAAAKEAAAAISQKFDCKVYVFDSLAATIACGFLVKEAVRMRDAGCDAEETIARVADLRRRLQCWVIADDLYYLKRGGRVSGAVAAVGTVLQIKPILSFTRDGKLAVVDKCKGMKKAYSGALKKMEKYFPVEENRMIWIVHNDAEKQAQELADLIENRFGMRPPVTIMGPVIGSHLGPGAVSVIWTSAEESESC